uniref:Selenocysteine lyase/Cysteine desulfurase n=1 Tax=Candidatus Kentrum sp. SD TaxID=2126332 RepID=A0A450YXW1_9GAMM|nr:MAG: Selenocysteine lyase/Cysteine desulfurase [Candidatus Kentron sp. SD]VFK46325.1 MAG: Selenocysteine lyase/Cysteine desulfurase [Candidatus Kentron sp. SD]VFK78410.1 MAG: Selenocysteine lyase/Cysteine desulfurase [Candidatus Kentron sp. SD]
MKNEFPRHDDYIYLNHAAIAPWPRRALLSIERLSKEMNAGTFRSGDWFRVEETLREQLRQLINAPSGEDIALLKNTSEGLSIVAHGLDWQSGDNIVITDQEFPSNRIVWQSLASRRVTVREAAIQESTLPEGASPEEMIEGCCDENTRLVAVSSVQYGTGLRMDLERIGSFCRRSGILFCVDAIQSLGAIPMDVQAIDADFLAADGHKWMLGPEGIAVFYCRRALRDRLTLRQYGWHMVEDHLNYDNRDWTVAASARRFECGSPNTLGIHALSASLSLLLEMGMDHVFRGVLGNASYLLNAITESKKLSLISPVATLNDPKRRSGIVTFHAPGIESPTLFRELIAAGIICALRSGGIRFSPHFYTPRQELENAMGRVKHIVS